MLRLSRRGKKRAAEATQFTYGKDCPFVIVPRVTGAQAIRPNEGPGSMQEFLIAPSTIVSQYQVLCAKTGQVRILPSRPKARPYYQPSYPTDNPDQWYGNRGAPNRPHYAAAPLSPQCPEEPRNRRTNPTTGTTSQGREAGPYGSVASRSEPGGWQLPLSALPFSSSN